MCIRDRFEADLETLAAHPHPEDGFAGMEIRGDTLTDKDVYKRQAEYGADGFRAFRDEEAIQAATIRELHEQYKPIVLEAVT